MIRRISRIAGLVLVALFGAMTMAAAQRRDSPLPDLGATARGEQSLALVVGNAAYPEAPLRNPVNDARAIAATLRRLGFEVIALENASAKEMQRALVEFGRRLQRGGGAGLFYYAGHGLQVKGQNYLVPVDAAITGESSVRFETVALESVTDAMGDAANRVNVVILDACRNNPFERRLRGQSRGLAAVDAARGTLIAYATAPGSVADDGSGANGTYTAALLDALKVPNLKAEEVFKRVRGEVVRRTNGEQTPWESSSLTGDLVFYPAAAPDTPPAATGFDARQIELAFWEAIQASTDPADFEDYLQRYPNGSFRGLAERRLKSMKAPAQVAVAPAPMPVPPEPPPRPENKPIERARPATDALDGVFVTLKRTPLRSEPAADARSVATLPSGARVTAIAKVRDADWIEIAPDGKRPGGFVPGASVKRLAVLEAEEWDRTRERRSADSLAGFLKRFPDGAHAAEAQRLREALRAEEEVRQPPAPVPAPPASPPAPSPATPAAAPVAGPRPDAVQPPKPDRRTDLQGSWKAVYDGDCTWRARVTIRDGKMTGSIDARNAHVDFTVDIAPDLGVSTNLYSSTFTLRTLKGQFPNLHVFGSGYCGTAYLDFARE